jgi:hypothetical protein
MATEEQKIVLDEKTTQIGFMMEAAAAQQKAAEALQEAAKANSRLADMALHRLEEHSRTLGPAMTEAFKASVHRSLLDGFADVHREMDSLVTRISRLYARARFRLLWMMPATVLSGLAITVAASWIYVPSPKEIAELRATVQQLESKGGRADLIKCVEPHKPGRLCIRVDAKAGTWGEDKDYMIIHGY